MSGVTTELADWTETEIESLQSSAFHLGMILKSVIDQIQLDRMQAARKCQQEQAA